MRQQILKFISDKDNPTIEEFDKRFSLALRYHAYTKGWIQYIHGLKETRVIMEA
jgi:hypothetical protein